MNLRPVLRNVNLLNILLLCASLVFAGGVLLPQLDTRVTYTPPVPVKGAAEKKKVEVPTPPPLSPQDYVVIADQNLFHPDRIIPVEKKAEEVLPKPEFVLYGTLIASDSSLAYMEDKKAPVSTPGRGQRQTVVKKGETISGFRLKEIMADRVVLVRGEETQTVLLSDQKIPKTRESLAGTTSPPKPSGVPTPGPSSSPAIGNQFPRPQQPVRGPTPPAGIMPSPGPAFPAPRQLPPGMVTPTRP